MIPIFDGHNDTVMLHVQDPERDFFSRQADGHLDHVRAKEGGLAGGFFAVFPPGPETPSIVSALTEGLNGGRELPIGPIDTASAVRYTETAVAQILRWSNDPQGRFRLVTSAAQLEAALEEGVFAAILHLEGAEAIGPDLSALDVYYAAGLRSLGLVWSRPNLFAEGVPFHYPASPDTGTGLTVYGQALVKRCNQLGIMLDLSHLNERGFWDVAQLSDAPLVATHSNAHTVCASARNLTDDQLKAVRDSNGVVGLNFATGFLAPDGESGPELPLSVMVQHVDHLVEQLGIDSVAFGSDFDGAGISAEIGDVAGLPKLMEALSRAGYDQESLEKIAYRNWLRVLRLTWGE